MAGDTFNAELKLRVTAETKRRINEIASSRPRGEGDSEAAVIREALREYLARQAESRNVYPLPGMSPKMVAEPQGKFDHDKPAVITGNETKASRRSRSASRGASGE